MWVGGGGGGGGSGMGVGKVRSTMIHSSLQCKKETIPLLLT